MPGRPTTSASVSVVEHDEGWRGLFESERRLLEPTLAPWLAGPIEHVGITAVPGLCTKPVIDIMIPVRSLEISKPATELLEQRHGYHYWPYEVAAAEREDVTDIGGSVGAPCVWLGMTPWVGGVGCGLRGAWCRRCLGRASHSGGCV